MPFTFNRGVHPSGKKALTKDIPLEQFPLPEVVFIPLSQHIGAPATPVVAVGDEVKIGTLIGKASGFVSANVYSSVCGTVEAIVKRRTAIGSYCDHVAIRTNGGTDEVLLPKLEVIDSASVKARIAEAGIVGMGGATFPTHVKLSPKTPVDTLIINAAECEPYITCDYRLCLEKTREILSGIKYLMTALGVSKACIGIEMNKPNAITALEELVPDDIDVCPLWTKYPQGGEKQLIYAITRRVVPAGGLPADVGVVVDNIHTALAVYEAVAEGKPSYRRAMTVSGKGITKPCNYWMPNGVPYDVIAKHSEMLPDTKKVISGGPMMGFAQPDLEPCTGKGTSSLLFLNPAEITRGNRKISQCINCGNCAAHCPMHLMPMFIEKSLTREDPDMLVKYGVKNCIECGCCAYSCPAGRPLVQSMRRAKQFLKERGM